MNFSIDIYLISMEVHQISLLMYFSISRIYQSLHYRIGIGTDGKQTLNFDGKKVSDQQIVCVGVGLGPDGKPIANVDLK